MGKISDISNGVVIRFRGELCMVSEFQRVSPGKGSSFVRTKLKNLATGKVVEFNFKDGDTVEIEEVNRRNMQFLYKSGDDATFMDNETYEQVVIPVLSIGESAKFLREGQDVMIALHNGEAISVTLPKKVVLRVVSAPSAVKGDTSSGNVLKDVELENSSIVRAPLFIKDGDLIAINTDTGEYVERVKE